MNTMTYKGYSARIEYDDKDSIFVGHLVGINDIVGFHAESVAELQAAFRESVDDYLDVCEKLGQPPNKPRQRQDGVADTAGNPYRRYDRR